MLGDAGALQRLWKTPPTSGASPSATAPVLALARHVVLPAVTADRKWGDIDVGVPVVLIR